MYSFTMQILINCLLYAHWLVRRVMDSNQPPLWGFLPGACIFNRGHYRPLVPGEQKKKNLTLLIYNTQIFMQYVNRYTAYFKIS